METTLDQFTAPTGLSEEEAALRLKLESPNELPAARRSNVLKVALQIAKDPIFLLLLVSGLIYLFLGDLQEALMLLGFVVFIMAISFYQELKTERTLETLKELTSPRARVIRDGQSKRIAGRDVVRGDILILNEGDRVPADAKILSKTHLSVDESLLTGESVPVFKTDDSPQVYSGTLVLQGQGLAEVIAVGAQTEIGKIGKAAGSLEPEKTALQKETSKLVQILMAVGLSLSAIVVVAYGLIRGNWLDGFLAGIALAMAILPNELPVVLTIFLAVGAWRISKKNVLTRRVPAIENLGAATVLCVDKTGTLTLNQMSLTKIFSAGEFYHFQNHTGFLPETFHSLIEFGILASQRDSFDPMEKALKKIGEDHLADTEHLHQDWKLVREYPLSKDLWALSHVWESPGGEDFVIAAKGSPEAIFDLCHLDQQAIAGLDQKVQSMAGEGLRVLGVAKSYFKKPTLPGQQHDFIFEFLGLLGFSDPIRLNVPAAVYECYQAGIRVIMITGDYPVTAISIARQIELSEPDSFLTGQEVESMSDDELQERIRTVNIFSRTGPEQKLRIVNALKRNGEVVAMTGDGVNDAPALKAAHIGIAMGGRGTDVAREAADLVLVDDDFSSIVATIKVGRRIFDNLKKAMAYLLAIHVPIAGISLIPVIFKWPLVLMPVHIAFLHLIINPACSVVFEVEPEEAHIMKRPPRKSREPLFDLRLVGLSILQGLNVLLILTLVFVIAIFRGQGELDARALSFTTLILANLNLILINRSWKSNLPATLQQPNPALWWVITGALVSLGFVLYTPFFRVLFHFSILHPMDLAVCILAAGLSIVGFEVLKARWTLKKI